ncbi:MAG: S1 family peptidase [Mycobacterium sp.]
MQVDTIAKALLFSTIRIENTKADGQETVGTGFLFNGTPDGSQDIPLLITNKHVIEDSAELRFKFLVSNADGSGPDLGKTLVSVRQGPATAVGVFGHPDPLVDVAAIAVADDINRLSALGNGSPYIKCADWTLLPSDGAAAHLDAIEELTFVGYPSGIADPVNHTPIVRQAITATLIGLRFGGKPTFLLDGAVFGGSSGSPVFIFNQGSWKNPVTGALMAGDRLILVGIIAEGYERHSHHTLQMPTAAAPFVAVAQALDLGVAFSHKAIEETVNHLLSSVGLPPGTPSADWIGPNSLPWAVDSGEPQADQIRSPIASSFSAYQQCTLAACRLGVDALPPPRSREKRAFTASFRSSSGGVGGWIAFP